MGLRQEQSRELAFCHSSPLSPWWLLCLVRLWFCVGCVPPLLWCASFCVFLSVRVINLVSAGLWGGGWLKVGSGGLLGVFLFLPSLFLGVAWGLRELHQCDFVICFTLATLLTFYSLLAM